jgi:dynein heavy chain
MPKLAPSLLISPVLIYQNSTAASAQKALEGPLEKKRKGLWAAPYGKKIAYCIDDLTMSMKDRYGQSGFLELLRQFFDFHQWYDARTAEPKSVESIQFVACATCNPSNPRHLLGTRNERHWAFVGVPSEQSHLRAIFGRITASFLQSWPLSVRGRVGDMMIDAALALRDEYNRLVKSTANKFMFLFNIRHLFRLIHGMSCVRADTMRNRFEVAKLWCSEAYRTTVDRVDDKAERKMFGHVIQSTAIKHFQLGDSSSTQRLPTKPGRPYYSHLYQEDKSFVVAEVERLKYLKPVLE